MIIRATKVSKAHRWSEPPADTVVLDFDDRHRRRMAMTGTRGLEFLLDLENAVALRGGDALVLDDGRLVEVVAAPEPLLEIRGRIRSIWSGVAWHLGNRHLPTQIMAQRLANPPRSRHRGDGARGWARALIEIEAPFDPEGGAYAEAAMRMRKPTRMTKPWPCGHDHAIMAMVDQHDHGIIMTTVTISMTSIAITTIITAIPMLMTTNKPPAKPRRSRQGGGIRMRRGPASDRASLSASEAAALYRLMTWLSPAFPVGAFSYSSGIEWAVEAGDITDADRCSDWLTSMLADGADFAMAFFWRMRTAPQRRPTMMRS